MRLVSTSSGDLAKSNIQNTVESMQTDRNAKPGARAVLVVDDNTINSTVLAKQLRKRGYLVRTANNGVEAIKEITAARSEPFDIVLMDIGKACTRIHSHWLLTWVSDRNADHGWLDVNISLALQRSRRAANIVTDACATSAEWKRMDRCLVICRSLQ